jgi:hypothetical protein
MNKKKLKSSCCNVDVYYSRGNYYCSKCNKSVIVILPKKDNWGDNEMPRPKRVD